MNSLTKKLPIIITASILVLSLAAVVLSQNGTISELRQTILNKEKNLALVELKLEEQGAITDKLEAQLQVYKDSIVILQLENERLHNKVTSLKGTISKLNQIIQKHDDKVAKLTTDINRLKESGRNNQDKIASLELQRDNLLKEMEAKDKQRIALDEEKKQIEKARKDNGGKIESYNDLTRNEMDKVDPAPALFEPPAINQSPAEPAPEGGGPNVSPQMQTAIISRQAEKLENIRTKTAVKYSSISLRNREGSNELKSVKKNENDWRYTFIDFDLENVDKEAIRDETFVLQVYDLDNNVVVPFNEKNMAFPNSDMGAIGYKFKYDGKPVSVRYINTQPKEGSNYELRLIYLNKKGLTFPLANGTKRIVDSGKVTVD